MKTTKILFPTDFSTLSQSALETATSLARDRNAELLVVHVQEPAAVYVSGDFYYGIASPDRREQMKMLMAVVPTDPAVPCEHRLIMGAPAEAIVELAKAEDVDMIVLATHGRTGLFRLVMGSVAEEIVRKATCPVLTVKAAAPSPAMAAH
jgi:nucleotide-binding universal stress UspA family protein